MRVVITGASGSLGSAVLRHFRARGAAMPDADPATWTIPQAIAEVIAFLASPAARAINGAMIPVTNAG